jgi:hypothetical protein
LFNGTVWAENEENLNTTFTLKLSCFTFELILEEVGYTGWITGSQNADGTVFLMNEGVQSVDGVVLPHFFDSYSAVESLESFARNTTEVYGFLQENNDTNE